MVLECGFEGEPGEKRADTGHQKLELGGKRVIVPLVVDWEPGVSFNGGLGGSRKWEPTMVVDHEFDITENFAIPAVGLFLGLDLADPSAFENTRWLRVEHERYGEQSLDPFWGFSLSKCINTEW